MVRVIDSQVSLSIYLEGHATYTFTLGHQNCDKISNLDILFDCIAILWIEMVNLRNHKGIYLVCVIGLCPVMKLWNPQPSPVESGKFQWKTVYCTWLRCVDIFAQFHLPSRKKKHVESDERYPYCCQEWEVETSLPSSLPQKKHFLQ